MKSLFRSIAACPACRGPLDWGDDGLLCRTDGCARKFRIEGGVPILDRGEDFGSIGPSAAAADSRSPVRRMLARLLSPGATTYKAKAGRDRQQRFVASLGERAIALNVGSGTDDYGPRVVNLDIGPFRNVDVVGRSEWLPVQSGAVDAVITTGVLEHVGDLGATLREVDRVLRPGGEIFHEIPFIQGFHGSHDYRRFTWQGIRQLALPGYELLDEGVALGPSSALVWLLGEWLGMLLSFGSLRVYHRMRPLAAKLISPLRFFDAFLETHPAAQLTACSLYVHARKPGGNRAGESRALTE